MEEDGKKKECGGFIASLHRINVMLNAINLIIALLLIVAAVIEKNTLAAFAWASASGAWVCVIITDMCAKHYKDIAEKSICAMEIMVPVHTLIARLFFDCGKFEHDEECDKGDPEK